MDDFHDREFTCQNQNCGDTFIWTAGEQRFLQRLVDEKKENRDGSYVTFIEPKRCPPCRQRKREERERKNLPV